MFAKTAGKPAEPHQSPLQATRKDKLVDVLSKSASGGGDREGPRRPDHKTYVGVPKEISQSAAGQDES